jgi:hypothetical protein
MTCAALRKPGSRPMVGRNGMSAQNRGLTGEQISALEMLAGCPDGCTEAVLKANGFTIGLLGKLIRAGLATATPGIVEDDLRFVR